jgi:transposase
LSRELFAELYASLSKLDYDIKAHDRRINRLCQQDALSRRFLDVPGIGPITATILASDIGDGKGYAKSRDYAASLGGCHVSTVVVTSKYCWASVSVAIVICALY